MKQVKYYRTDKKTTEIKRLHKEKDELLDKLMKYELIVKDMEEKNAMVLKENQKLHNNMFNKTAEWKELNNLLAATSNPKVQSKLANIPINLQTKHIVRITELETEIEELKELIKAFELMSKKNSVSGDAKEVIEKMSVMLLNKNEDPNFFSESQKELIKSLFGDYATKMYKEKILNLETKLKDSDESKLELMKEDKIMIERWLYYISILSKFNTKNVDVSVRCHLPTQDSLVDNKISLIERMNDLEQELNNLEPIEDQKIVVSSSAKKRHSMMNTHSEIFLDDSKLEFNIELNSNYEDNQRTNKSSERFNLIRDDRTKSNTTYDD